MTWFIHHDIYESDVRTGGEMNFSDAIFLSSIHSFIHGGEGFQRGFQRRLKKLNAFEGK